MSNKLIFYMSIQLLKDVSKLIIIWMLHMSAIPDCSGQKDAFGARALAFKTYEFRKYIPAYRFDFSCGALAHLIIVGLKNVS
jgi:hypothetical protein